MNEKSVWAVPEASSPCLTVYQNLNSSHPPSFSLTQRSVFVSLTWILFEMKTNSQRYRLIRVLLGAGSLLTNRSDGGDSILRWNKDHVFLELTTILLLFNKLKHVQKWNLQLRPCTIATFHTTAAGRERSPWWFLCSDMLLSENCDSIQIFHTSFHRLVWGTLAGEVTNVPIITYLMCKGLRMMKK